MYTVFALEHRKSGKVYVGITNTTVEKRWHRLVWDAEKAGRQSPIYDEIRRSGKTAFSARVLAETDFKVEAEKTAEEWIRKLSADSPERGYNQSLARAEEIRKKQSEAAKKRWQRPEYASKIRADHSYLWK